MTDENTIIEEQKPGEVESTPEGSVEQDNIDTAAQEAKQE